MLTLNFIKPSKENLSNLHYEIYSNNIRYQILKFFSDFFLTLSINRQGISKLKQLVGKKKKFFLRSIQCTGNISRFNLQALKCKGIKWLLRKRERKRKRRLEGLDGLLKSFLIFIEILL